MELLLGLMKILRPRSLAVPVIRRFDMLLSFFIPAHNKALKSRLRALVLHQVVTRYQAICAGKNSANKSS